MVLDEQDIISGFFSVYIDKFYLDSTLETDMWKDWLCYADELTMLSPIVCGLQKMVSSWEEFANGYSSIFISSKTLCICLGSFPVCPQPQID